MIPTSLVGEQVEYEHGGTQKHEYLPDEVVAVPCPVCGSDNKERLYTEHQSIGISRCLACSLIYASPRLKTPEEVYWGDAEKYWTEGRLIFEGKAAHHRDRNYLEEFELIERYKRTGRFLDVGCNMGLLLRLAKQRGWTAIGVEPSPSASRLAREKLGLTVYTCFLHELPKELLGSFDVVAMSDIFEHVCDPLALLEQVGRFLQPDGILYIKVPNARWNLFKQKVLAFKGQAPTEGLWDSYEHVVHYTDATLAAVLERAGFAVLRMAIARPVQLPAWHRYVGQYYLYPSPWYLDWRRHLGRSLFYALSLPERLLRLGSIGYLAPNIVALARRR